MFLSVARQGMSLILDRFRTIANGAISKFLGPEMGAKKRTNGFLQLFSRRYL